jgi:hypothetical protein
MVKCGEIFLQNFFLENFVIIFFFSKPTHSQHFVNDTHWNRPWLNVLPLNQTIHPFESIAFLGGMGTWTYSIIHDQSKFSNTNILPTLPYMKGAFDNDSLL